MHLTYFLVLALHQLECGLCEESHKGDTYCLVYCWIPKAQTRLKLVEWMTSHNNDLNHNSISNGWKYPEIQGHSAALSIPQKCHGLTGIEHLMWKWTDLSFELGIHHLLFVIKCLSQSQWKYLQFRVFVKTEWAMIWRTLHRVWHIVLVS